MDFDFTGFSIVHLNDSDILHERRVILGLTQKQVAERANIPFQNYQRFESGERNIRTASFNMACKILTALEIDIDLFYKGEYTFGEKIESKKGELCYQKTGKSIDYDPEDEEKSNKQ